MLEVLLVYALLTSAMFYLGSRAVITSWLWSRYPPKLASFMDCAACSGFWYGLIVGVVGIQVNGARIHLLGEWWSPVVIALCSMVWTPIIASLQHAAFERLGDATAEAGDGEA